ncbi:MAG: cytochrome c oxidase assembly protein [Alphaproteobacteria bacterium]|nr:cytochrome c oxidase assembly protein [Alphaproteobacteria bacterium]
MDRPAPDRAAALKARNRRVMRWCVGVVGLMVVLSFASAPFYRMFCQVTGFGGATVRADRAPGDVLDRVVTVRFNADTDPALAWEFKPAQRQVAVKLGEQTLAFYTARNLSNQTIAGTATFNVTPDKAGGYFDKIACFCFTEQTLAPGQSIDMGVSFFVDPDMAKDPNMGDVNTITLSYTFYRAKDQPPARTATAKDTVLGVVK